MMSWGSRTDDYDWTEEDPLAGFGATLNSSDFLASDSTGNFDINPSGFSFLNSGHNYPVENPGQTLHPPQQFQAQPGSPSTWLQDVTPTTPTSPAPSTPFTQTGVMPATPSTPGIIPFSFNQPMTPMTPSFNPATPSSPFRGMNPATPSAFSGSGAGAGPATGHTRPPTLQKITQAKINEPPHQLLQAVKDMLPSQTELLRNMGVFQDQFLKQPTTEAFNQLLSKQVELKKNLEIQHNGLTTLKTQEILTLQQASSRKNLQDLVELQAHQLSLYQSELVSSLEQKPNQCCAMLVIESQPFPNVYKDKTRIDEEPPVVIKLLKCSTLKIVEVSTIKVTCVVTCNNELVQIPMENPFTHLDPTTLTAKYNLSRFGSASKMQAAYLKFELSIKTETGAQLLISSPPSRPFVVTAHESQWEEAMRVLFISDVYKDAKQVQWKVFANELTSYFCKAIRQDLMKSRGLSLGDFYFLQKHKLYCADDGAVSVNQYYNFWEWFGKILRELRFKKKLLPLWNLGLIYGFIDKDQLMQYMQYQKPGHTLLRFSDSHPGGIAATAIIVQGTPKLWNGLIRVDETKLKTHADHMRENPNITHLLQFQNQYTTNASGVASPVLVPLEKGFCLSEFYTERREGEKKAEGYDTWFNESQNRNDEINHGDFGLASFYGHNVVASPGPAHPGYDNFNSLGFSFGGHTG